jgi:hypothetical protein
MPWDQVATDAAAQQNYSRLQQALEALPYYQELITRGIGGGPEQMTSAKGVVENSIANMKAETNSRRQMAREIADQTEQADMTALSNQIDTLAPQVEQQKTIYQLRTEQATALANKYAGSSYSLWWGLWFPLGLSKPLSDTTRIIVYAVSAGLLGITVWAATKPRGAPPPPVVADQAGGRRKKRSSG